MQVGGIGTRSTKRMLAVFAISLLAAAATACDDDEGSGNGNGSDATAGGSGGPSGTLRVAMDFKPDDWETLTKPNTTFTRIPYEGLVYTTPDASKLIPRLATSWDVKDREVRFQLRKGVEFHDGTPFNADAVIANIEHIRETPSAWQSTFDSVAEAVAEDDHTLVLKLKRPDPDLLANLAARGAYIISPKALKSGSFKQRPSGTGPWRINEEESVTDFKYVFDYFDKYWDKSAIGPEKLEMYNIPDANARYSALQSGQADIAWLDPTQAENAVDAGMKRVSYPMLRYHLLMFDRGKGGALGDPLVRKAICHSVDTDSMLKATYAGLGGTPNQRFRRTSPAYVDDLDGYDFDLEKAKQLMKEAGNPKVSFQMPFFPSVQPTHEILKEDLAEIGIDLEVIKLTVPEYFSVYETDKYPLIYNTSTSEDAGPYSYYQYRFAEDSSGNPHHVPPPPELAQAVDQAVASTSEEAGAEHWQEMIRILNDQALDCGFLDVPGVWAYDPDKLGNVVPTLNEPSAFRYREAQVK